MHLLSHTRARASATRPTARAPTAADSRLRSVRSAHCAMAARDQQQQEHEAAKRLIPDGARALLFDVDGTILDTGVHRLHSWREAAGKHGLKVSEADYWGLTGMKGTDLVKKLAADQGVQISEADCKDVVATESKLFTSKGLKQVQPIGLVMQVIEEGRRRGLKMGVVSGGEAEIVEQSLKDAGVEDAFEVVVSSGDVEHAKPEPDIYLLAADKLGIEPAACVAYEDAPLGLESARRAGFLDVIDVTTFKEHPEKEMKDDEASGRRGEIEGKAREVM